MNGLKSIKNNRVPIWILAGFWLFILLVSPAKFRFEGSFIAAGFFILLGFVLLFRIPSIWLEINRKDGLITIWSSRKKREIIAKEHIENLSLKSIRRHVSTNSRLGRGEYRYFISLVYRDNRKKNQFCDLFELFRDGTYWDQVSAEGFTTAWYLTQSIEQFVHKFMRGEPLPDAVRNMYTFTMK